MKGKKIKLRSLIFLMFFIYFFSGQLYAQPANDNCFSATTLCSGYTISTSNINASPECGGADGECGDTYEFCFGVDNSVWFKFRTNSFGGSATILIDNIVSVNGNDTLQAALISTTSPCDTSGYTILNCISSATGTLSITSSLQPNTLYWIIVDGKRRQPPPAECNFDISISGPAVQHPYAITSTPATCSGNDGSITVSGPSGAFYSLNSGASQTSGNFTSLPAGSYQVTVKDQTGCDTVLVTTISGSPITNASATTAFSDCNLNTGSITVNSVTGGTSPYTYTLNGNSQSSSTFTGLGPGTYSVVVTDASSPNCPFSINNLFIYPDKPYLSLNIKNTDCNANNGTITVSAVSGSTPYSYSILPAGSGTFAGNTFSNLPLGSYNVIVTGANTCADTVATTINLKNPITDLVYTTTAVKCNSSFGSIKINSVYGGTAPIQYSFNGSPFQSSPDFSSVSTGSYILQAKDAKGCTFEKTIIVGNDGNVKCSAGQDQVVFPGSVVTLQGHSDGLPVSWSPASTLTDSNSLTPLFTTPENLKSGKSFRFFLSTVSPEGCVCKDTVFIEVIPTIVPVPNAFSPNGDGFNDVWEIPNLQFYPECEVNVYSRWGQRVFHSVGYELGKEWDGKYLGLDVPSATYYFTIRLNVDIEGVQDFHARSLTVVR